MIHFSRLCLIVFFYNSILSFTTGFTKTKIQYVAVHDNSNKYINGNFHSFKRSKNISRGIRRDYSYVRLSSSATSENAINALLTEAIKIASKTIDKEKSTKNDSDRKKLPFYLKFSSRHIESINLVDQEKAVAYLSLPASSYSVINTTLVTRQSNDTFRFTLPLQEITSMTPLQINANLMTDITVNPQPQDNKVVMRSGSMLFEPLPCTSKSPYLCTGSGTLIPTTATNSEEAVSGITTSNTTAYQEVDELGLPLWILWGEDEGKDENIKLKSEISLKTDNIKYAFNQSHLNNNNNNDTNVTADHPNEIIMDSILADNSLLAMKGSSIGGMEPGLSYDETQMDVVVVPILSEDNNNSTLLSQPLIPLQAYKKSAIQAEVVIKLEWDDNHGGTTTATSSTLSQFINTTTKRSFNGIKSILGFLPPKKGNDLLQMEPAVGASNQINSIEDIKTKEMVEDTKTTISIHNKTNASMDENSTENTTVIISNEENNYFSNSLQVRATVEVHVNICMNLPAKYSTTLSFFPIRNLIERAAGLTTSSVLKAIGPGLATGLQKDYLIRKDNGLFL